MDGDDRTKSSSRRTNDRGNHPLRGDLYTPITPEILHMLDQLHVRFGTWAVVAYHAKTSQKVLRNIRHRRHAISMTVLDRIITETGTGRLDDYTWFTADDLVTMGIWKPVITVEGRERVQGNHRWLKQRGRRPKNEHENGKPE